MNKQNQLDKIKSAIENGIEFLEKSQLKDGSFLSLSSPKSDDFSCAAKYASIFPSALILSCLADIKNPRSEKIKQKIAGFLISQKSGFWTFNYWKRDSEEAKKLPYPDDLDDTFCALAALKKFNPDLIDGSALAKIVAVLTSAEKKEGGPYRTWIVSESADSVWKDIDLAVNSNIAYFLSLEEIDLPNLENLIEAAAKLNKYSSPYYPSAYPIIYFISRFYKGSKRGKITDFLLSGRDKNGDWRNPLNSALAISSLINFGIFEFKDIEKGFAQILREQKKGAWKPNAFCIDPAINQKKHYAGSAALTTAFVLEALKKYFQTFEKSSGADFISSESGFYGGREGDIIIKKAESSAEKIFSPLDKDLKKKILAFADAMIKKNKDKQIVLLPYFFALSCGEKVKNIPQKFLVKLGLANLCGWIAYTIYDDFLDGEGDPEFLSAANAALRQAVLIFSSLKLPEFNKIFTEVLDGVDSANDWEIKNCRIKSKKINIPDFGDYSALARKSFGHALGPIAILESLGYKNSSPEAKNLYGFFKHYLIAKQMNDDAHDWEEDLKRGYINSAGALILKKAQEKKIKFSADENSNFISLQEIFWREIIPTYCAEIIRHANSAVKYLEKISIIESPKPLKNLVLNLEKSAQTALKERREAMKFLESYKPQHI